jgi:flagellar biosynthesis/type III secretory pathway chaperone
VSLELKGIMEKEYSVLQELFKVLVDQNHYLLKRDAFKLDSVVKSLEEKSKTVALLEIKRRKLTSKRPMREIIAEEKDESMKILYDNIVEILGKIRFQRDTNDALIKQGLVFTNQMLRAIAPRNNTSAGTYNSLGKSR